MCVYLHMQIYVCAFVKSIFSHIASATCNIWYIYIYRSLYIQMYTSLLVVRTVTCAQVFVYLYMFLCVQMYVGACANSISSGTFMYRHLYMPMHMSFWVLHIFSYAHAYVYTCKYFHIQMYVCACVTSISSAHPWREVGGWGRDPKKCTGRDWGMGSSTI